MKQNAFKLTNWRQVFMRPSCYWDKLRHNIVKVTVEPQTADGKSIMTRFIFNKRTDA